MIPDVSCVTSFASTVIQNTFELHYTSLSLPQSQLVVDLVHSVSQLVHVISKLRLKFHLERKYILLRQQNVLTILVKLI